MASSPLVPRNDPTLMFTNAGMVQFKNVFTGIRDPALPARRHLPKVRARGRQAQRPRQRRLHRAPPHLLRDAGQLLVRRLLQGARHRARLAAGDERTTACRKSASLVTVFAEDDEAHGLWRKIAGLPEERVIRIPTSDNFWAMGETGPCGPCSEIFYDHGPAHRRGPARQRRSGRRPLRRDLEPGVHAVRAGHARRADRPAPPLDRHRHGARAHRRDLQGTHDNYETDLFQQPDRSRASS